METKTPLSVTQVQSVTDADYVDLTLSNGQKARILKTKLLPVATNVADGLMPKYKMPNTSVRFEAALPYIKIASFATSGNLGGIFRIWNIKDHSLSPFCSIVCNFFLTENTQDLGAKLDKGTLGLLGLYIVKGPRVIEVYAKSDIYSVILVEIVAFFGLVAPTVSIIAAGVASLPEGAIPITIN